MSHAKEVQLYSTTVARLDMLLELALENELTSVMLHQTRYYSQSDALYVLAFITEDVKYLKWFLDEAHSINLICSYETRDLREPVIQSNQEAIAALHALEQEVVAEVCFLEVGMTERYDSLPWRGPKEVS